MNRGKEIMVTSTSGGIGRDRDPDPTPRVFCSLILAGALGLAVQPLTAASLTASCDAQAAGRCYNAGAFELTASSPGADRFKICRSHDTTGWGGCDVLVSGSVPAVGGVGTFTVYGEHLATDGFRRAYYVSACDAAGTCSKWKDSAPVYVYRDTSAPDPVSVTTASPWLIDDGSVYQVVATASDATSGVAEVRVQINRSGSSAEEPRGIFTWNESVYRWSLDRVPCTGGGFASKYPGGFRPTTVTLVGCSTSESAGTRTVTFELLPNPTFGARRAANDISLRSFDRVDNRSSWQSFDLDFSSLRSWFHQADGIGYQGIVDGAGLEEANQTGVAVDVGTLLYLRKECSASYWRNVDTAGILAAYQAQNVKAMVILENFLFKNVNDPVGDDCQPLDPPPVPDPSPCFNDTKWRLVPDWRERLAEFDALHGAYLTPDTVALMLVSSEVNDRCFDLAEVEEVADEIRARFPDLPLAMIYGATHGTDGVRESQPPPPYFPAVFDIVGLFSYNLYDVNDPLEPRNATGTFYDPEDPENPLTIYGDLLSKLQPHQEVLLVFEANYGGPKSTLGWNPEELGDVALHDADFTSYRPEITILGGFTWQGLLGLPQSVIDLHADLACSYVDNDSPLCGPELDPMP
jgi:hypothetical protein